MLADGSEKAIETVLVGDEVITHTGRVGIACRTQVRPHKGSMKVLKIAGLPDVIALTPEHPVYVVKKPAFEYARKELVHQRKYNGFENVSLQEAQVKLENALKPEFVEAGRLSIGDRVFIPFPTEVGHCPELRPLDYDFATLLGYYASEGCLEKHKNLKKYKNGLRGIVFVFGPNDTNAIERVKAICRKNGHLVSPLKNKKDAGIRVELSWTELAGICEKHVGSGSQHKGLSKELMRMPLEWQKHFLGAYLSGDGHYTRKSNHVRYEGVIKASTASGRLASDLQKLCARLAITMSVSRRMQIGGFAGKPTSIHEMGLTPSSVCESGIWKYCDRFSEPKPRLNQGKLRIHNGYIVSYVSKVTDEEFDGPVYNFEVTGDNSYVARSIAVHNCNGNGDAFEDAELQKSWKTFIRRGNYLNHESETTDKAVGIILDAKYWTEPGTFYVECLLAVDRSQPIANNIEKGISDSVSMGALVDQCNCSVCDKVATNESEYCDHLKNYMGKDYNGKKVFAYNRGVNFYELSWVTVPADPNAKALQVIAEKEPKPSAKFEKLTKLADAYQGNVKKADITCQDCGKVLKDADDYFNHKNTAHEDETYKREEQEYKHEGRAKEAAISSLQEGDKVYVDTDTVEWGRVVGPATILEKPVLNRHNVLVNVESVRADILVPLKDIFPEHSASSKQAALPDNVSIKETIDGHFMVLVDGIQHGGDRDRSGAGNKTFSSREEAKAYANEISKEAAPRLKEGDHVQISGLSGLNSDKTGVIVSTEEFMREVGTNERGVPKIDGYYKPVDWGKEYPIRLDDGSIITMFKNRVNPVSEKEAAPQPPQLKKEPKPDPTLQSTVESIIGKEVQHEVERELIGKVRDALKKLQPQKTMNQEVSDDSILSAVRTELTKRMSSPAPVTSELHQVVNKTLADLEKEDNPEPLDLGSGYTVVPTGKVAGKEVVQLYRSGEATGLFALRTWAGDASQDPGPEKSKHVAWYKKQFSLQEDKNQEMDINSTEESINTMGQLVITYEPGKTLETSMFTARKGNLVARQSAANLLNEETKKTIVAAESGKTAAGKVDYGVGDYDSTKGKVDHKMEEGKEDEQPGNKTKSLGPDVDLKIVNDTYDATKGKKDTDFVEGKEPIQPSQVVSKYASLIGGKVTKLAEDKKTGTVRAEVEGGSLARLAQVWKVQAQIVKAADSKKAMVSGTPGGWAKETTKPVSQEPMADITKVTTVARETPKAPAGAAPSGSRGGEQIKYYQQWDKGTLAETGDGWARKVASLTAKAKVAEAKVTQLDTENRLLKAALEKTKKAQEDEKRNNLVEAIMQRLIATGNLEPKSEDILDLKERGLVHDDAVAKATANLHDQQKKDLAALDIAALEKMKDMINRYEMNPRTAEKESMKSLDVPIVGTDSYVQSPEEKLSQLWS